MWGKGQRSSVTPNFLCAPIIVENIWMQKTIHINKIELQYCNLQTYHALEQCEKNNENNLKCEHKNTYKKDKVVKGTILKRLWYIKC